jgi:hypothetical protein
MRRAALLLLALLPLAARAQELESLGGIRLTFDAPSTRAAGMGGATAAIRDADSALSNPASIAGASRSITIEGRSFSSDRRFINAFNDDGFTTMSARATNREITRATMTMPVTHGTVSLFYDQPIDAQSDTRKLFIDPYNAVLIPYASILVNQGRLIGDITTRATRPGPCYTCFVIQMPVPVVPAMNASLRLQRFGAASAWTRGAFAFGTAVRYERLEQDTATLSLQQYGAAERTHDSSIAYSAGMSWTPNARTRIAAAYTSGNSFDSARTFLYDPQHNTKTTFRTPASMRAGVALDATKNLTLAADLVRIGYSSMMHGDRRLVDTNLYYPDVTELHAGAEWRVSPSLALRAGWWKDPAHHLSFHGSGPLPLMYAEVLGIQEGAEKHVTAGAGLGSGRLRLNAAIDHGDRSTSTSMGIATTF